MSEAIVRDFEVRIGRKLKEREAGVLSELVEKAEREREELIHNTTKMLEWLDKYWKVLGQADGIGTDEECPVCGDSQGDESDCFEKAWETFEFYRAKVEEKVLKEADR